jgi:hypothetical protein
MTDNTEISTATSIEQTQLPTESTEIASESSQNNSQPAETQKYERTYTRDELAKIANAESKKAYEKGKSEALETSKRDQEARQQQQVNTSNDVTNPALTDEELETRINRIAQQRANEAKLYNEAQTFRSKLDLENDVEMKLNYEKLNLDKMPMAFVHILNSVDNTKDIVKEFAQFPEKLTTIINTANIFGIDPGKEALKRISESIKNNQEAAGVRLPNAPLSQIGASSTGTDNGQMTSADYRKAYAGRF